MTTKEFKAWMARYICTPTFPTEEWPSMAEALRSIADDIDKAYKATGGKSDA